MTLTEKLLARASGKAHVSPGENVWVETDVLLTHDVCGPGTIGVFKREFGKNAKVWDKTQDRHHPRPLHLHRRLHVQPQRRYPARLRARAGPALFLRRHRRPERPLDLRQVERGQLKPSSIGSRYAGVCHTALPAKGHPRPGEILFGTDSHTCMAGAFNMFATGIGNTDAGFILGTGKLLVKVPRDDALLPRRQAAARRHGQGRHPARHRRDRLRRRHLPRHAVRGPRRLCAEHRRPHDDRQHGHRGRRQERRLPRRRKDLRLRQRAHASTTARSPPTTRSRSMPDQKFIYDETFDLSEARAHRRDASRSRAIARSPRSWAKSRSTAPTSAPAPAARRRTSSPSRRSSRAAA